MNNGPAGDGAAQVSRCSGDLVSTARARAALIEAEAEKAEATGTLTSSVVEAFREGKLLWTLVPSVLGGFEADIVTFLEVIEEVSRSDGSAGWSLMASALSTGFAGSYLGDTAAHEVFSSEDAAVFAGMPAPVGKARSAKGGYMVAGRYQFASGSGYANWLLSGSRVSEGDEQGKQLVYCLPKAEVRMLGGWDVLGLEGTGSYDYEVSERFVERGCTFDFASPVPQRGGPMYRLGIPVLGSSGHAGVAIGIARRALEEIARIAAGKVRGDMPCVADQPLFQHAFASHEAAFQAARSLTWDVFGRAQVTVEAGHELSQVDVQRVRQTVTYITGVTADIVNFCYTWSGSAGLRNPSALGRCLRDIYACTQHKYVDPNTLVDAGRSLLTSWQTARHPPANEPMRPDR